MVMVMGLGGGFVRETCRRVRPRVWRLHFGRDDFRKIMLKKKLNILWSVYCDHFLRSLDELKKF